VQHNFERTYHAPESAWQYVEAGLQGSSYLKLPALLAWCSADIGIHHVHHVHARVPNYRLEEARRALPALAAVPPLGWADLKRCFTHVYWDGGAGRMIDPVALNAADDPAVRPPAAAA
jgi:omega-6 fatty acid desaturase (delta-12 desaturase)